MKTEAADRRAGADGNRAPARDQRARQLRRDLVLDRDVRPPAAGILRAEQAREDRRQARRGCGRDPARRPGTRLRRRGPSALRSSRAGGAHRPSRASVDRTSPSADGGSAWNMVRCAGKLVALGRIMGAAQADRARRRSAGAELGGDDQRPGHWSRGSSSSCSNALGDSRTRRLSRRRPARRSTASRRKRFADAGDAAFARRRRSRDGRFGSRPSRRRNGRVRSPPPTTGARDSSETGNSASPGVSLARVARRRARPPRPSPAARASARCRRC